MDLIFLLFGPKKCLLVYSSAFFIDLPVSSFVFLTSLMTVKSNNQVIACDCQYILEHTVMLVLWLQLRMLIFHVTLI